MMLRFACRFCAWIVVAALVAPLAGVPVAAPAHAESQPQAAEAGRIAALSDLLKMDQVIAVTVDEGMEYGASIETQMFPGQGGARWQGIVAGIYDSARLREMFDRAFAEAIAGDEAALAAAEAFFGTARGQEIVALEIEARRALMDEAVEEAAQVEAERLQSERDPRVRVLRDFIAAGDLVEMNVAGALSANLAFYTGMDESGAQNPGMTREDLMSEVWGQEDSIRTETVNWLYPYLVLAYQPLSDADLAAYLEYSESPEGQRLNAALFAGYDAVFQHVSYQLGRAAALVMQGRDI
ncbi:MAG: DUF2059 domain-containing protein [Paracoccaceae bacterium]